MFCRSGHLPFNVRMASIEKEIFLSKKKLFLKTDSLFFLTHRERNLLNSYIIKAGLWDANNIKDVIEFNDVKK